MKRIAFLAIILLVAFVRVALPQSFTASLSVSSSLTISTTNSSVDFGTITTTGTKTSATQTTVTYSGNSAFTIRASYDADYFSSLSGNHDTSLPASAQEYSIDNGSTWHTFSATPVLLSSSGSASGSFAIKWRLQAPLVPPDTYTLSYTFSITGS